MIPERQIYISFLKSILILVFLNLLPVIIVAQETEEAELPCGITHDKKITKLYEEALSYNKRGKKDIAMDLLQQVLDKDDTYVEALFFLGDEFYNKALNAKFSTNEIQKAPSYYARAERNFLKVIEVCPSFGDFYAYFNLGKFYYSVEDYSKAKSFMTEFVKGHTQNKDDIQRAKNNIRNCEEYEYLMNNPVPFDPKPVEGICSKADEYLPLISPDGDLAFFTHRFSRKNTITNSESFIEEFTVSERIEEGKEIFKAGIPMPPPFNQGKNQGGVAISIDNNHVYITICEMTQGAYGPYNNCDIYSSDYGNGKWSQLKNLGQNVNGSDTWESQPTLSADGKTLYFSSIRKGNIGFSPDNPTCDIWKTEMGSDGRWAKAVNLGTKINTTGNEKSPFIHTDSQTLYFSSDGLFGLGGYDIFYSKLKDDGEWETPKNIGYPINTTGDDVGFIVSTDGKKAYFSSNRFKGVGGWDIFSFDLYKEARPVKVALIKGTLKDEKGKELKNAKVEIKNTVTNKVTEAMVDKISGKYAVVIKVEDEKKEDFLMVVKKDGYAFTSEYIKPYEDEKVEKPAITVNFDVKRIAVGEAVKLNNIQFGHASAKFDEASQIVLNNFAEFLEDNLKIKIAIHGHTDNTGTAHTNLKLSEERAKAVYDYLLIMGIDAKRMSFKGFGQTKPIASNNTTEGKALNRRTEFVIVSK
ncbi:MAG: hypothetical protein A2275_08620 [Bacteroidetes bacterium RIFOXYA12_FULL_35_11]|nr:MAG: hypothetical protein A2X01_09435 [Bacteroidetes bacterium GWF2_35_48]OFY75990.1 MAG: hypothetical protein A2275_08620 [Bacteroidetes bacterium RIFOXYA12_FULL_35_11]OFY95676.1 MAG: hypothetical protein A2309_07610 [Bacteroidetes bacterium RIFOXYB2_FULL_35_7]OFY97390.1 MAG: hypothetical protein A2491_15875 [Bacteroidetes bacterium RIFOXYC12_FULL_35_7]HBX53697.1 hypothetical protein [Bacteroidales bacterium]